jgi:predicted HTH transcriptional regulator
MIHYLAQLNNEQGNYIILGVDEISCEILN